MLDIYRKVEQRRNEENMQVSKAGDKQIRALALGLSADIQDYAEGLAEKALDKSTCIRINNATRDIETCA